MDNLLHVEQSSSKWVCSLHKAHPTAVVAISIFNKLLEAINNKFNFLRPPTQLYIADYTKNLHMAI